MISCMIKKNEYNLLQEVLSEHNVMLGDILEESEITMEQSEILRNKLLKLRENINDVLSLFDIGSLNSVGNLAYSRNGWRPRKVSRLRKHEEGARQIIEGVFDGYSMICGDGKRYIVPENYASKSKLVEGDIMKLVISRDGGFTYKQISPINRERLEGLLAYNNDGNDFFVKTKDGRSWKILKASVSYFNGAIGDHVIFYVPVGGHSTWAAVEHIFQKSKEVNTDDFIEEDSNCVIPVNIDTSSFDLEYSVDEDDNLKKAFFEGLAKIDLSMNRLNIT